MPLPALATGVRGVVGTMSLLYGHCNTTLAYTHSSAHNTMHCRSRASQIRYNNRILYNTEHIFNYTEMVFMFVYICKKLSTQSAAQNARIEDFVQATS